MPRQQQQEQSFHTDMRTGFHILYIGTNVLTAGVRPVTRSGMGTRGIGAPGFWTMLFIPLYAGTTNSPEMLTYWYVWVVMVIYRRITADRHQHTNFQGWVWAFDWLIKDELNARRLEAVSMLIVGNLLSAWSEPVGQFVSYASYALGVQCVLDAMTRTRQKEAAHNAKVEMLAMQVRFQEQQRF